MPLYFWTGRDNRNRERKGEIEAPNEKAVRATLLIRGIVPTKVEEKSKELLDVNITLNNDQQKQQRQIIQSLKCFGKLLEHTNNISFAFQDLMMFMELLLESDDYKNLKELWDDVYIEISSGSSLAESLKNNTYGLVEIEKDILERIDQGQIDGNLPKVLSTIDKHEGKPWEPKPELQSKINDSRIVNIVNTTLISAYRNNAKQIALNSLSDGESIFRPKPIPAEDPDEDSDLMFIDIDFEDESEEGTDKTRTNFQIYFNIGGKWEAFLLLPIKLKNPIYTRLLFMTALPYYMKSESEGKATITIHDITLGIKVHYYPESERMIVDILKEEKR